MTSGIVPESAFEPLTIKEGETWALYVLTSTSDQRYTMGTSIGQVFASSPELDILEGAGAANYPAFGSEYGGIEYTFYAPRVFNGILRYDYIALCPTEAPSLSLAPTSGTFEFLQRKEEDLFTTQVHIAQTNNSLIIQLRYSRLQ